MRYEFCIDCVVIDEKTTVFQLYRLRPRFFRSSERFYIGTYDTKKKAEEALSRQVHRPYVNNSYYYDCQGNEEVCFY